MRIPLCLAILSGLAVAAPAAAQTSAAAAGPCRQDAVPTETTDPAEHALLSAIIDTVEMDLKEAARTAGISQPAGLVIVELRDRRTGEARTSSYRSNLPDRLSAEVVARRAALLARLPERHPVMFVRLDPLPATTDSSPAECMPGVKNPRNFAFSVSRITQRVAPAAPGSSSRLTMALRMLVTRDGDVAYAGMSRGSGRNDVDREVLQTARRLRFDPASVGAVPVDVWVEQPLEVQLPDAPRSR